MPLTLIEEIIQKYKSPFFLVSQKKIFNQIELWHQCLPEVTPFYAVKCNNHPAILRILANAGLNFDCASPCEIERILELVGDPSRIIFAHPVKAPQAIKFARDKKVDLMTFDSLSELDKIRDFYPEARLVMRIQSDEGESKIKFNDKYGVPHKNYTELISKCIEYSLNLVGISFHVGSKASNSSQYLNSLASCRQVCELVNKFDKKIKLIDLGGGFPVIKNTFEELIFLDIAQNINREIRTIREQFGNDIQFIAEPGRYIVGNSHLLFLEIIGKKEYEDEEGDHMVYYVDDNIYKSFNNLIFDNENVVAHVVRNVSNKEKTYTSTIFGESCDGIDVILKSVELPELKIGDRIYFDNMGAYTYSSSSTFNGFSLPQMIIK